MPKASADFKTKKPLYKPVHSDRAGKKGMVYVMKNGSKSLIHFGDSSMTDKTTPERKDVSVPITAPKPAGGGVF